jgi:hypothetical protein
MLMKDLEAREAIQLTRSEVIGYQNRIDERIESISRDSCAELVKVRSDLNSEIRKIKSDITDSRDMMADSRDMINDLVKQKSELATLKSEVTGIRNAVIGMRKPIIPCPTCGHKTLFIEDGNDLQCLVCGDKFHYETETKLVPSNNGGLCPQQ